MFHYEVLEADMEGHTPDQDKDNPYGLTGYDPVGPNCIEIVAKQDLEVRISEWLSPQVPCSRCFVENLLNLVNAMYLNTGSGRSRQLQVTD